MRACTAALHTLFFKKLWAFFCLGTEFVSRKSPVSIVQFLAYKENKTNTIQYSRKKNSPIGIRHK